MQIQLNNPRKFLPSKVTHYGHSHTSPHVKQNLRCAYCACPETKFETKSDVSKCACAIVHKSSIFIVLIVILQVLHVLSLLCRLRRRLATRPRRPVIGHGDFASLLQGRSLVGGRDLPRTPNGTRLLAG